MVPENPHLTLACTWHTMKPVTSVAFSSSTVTPHTSSLQLVYGVFLMRQRSKANPYQRRQPSAGRATIHDVAAAAAVSVATVSRVLNGTANVMPETLARVRAAVDTLNFVPSSVARNLSLQRTNTLGLLFPEISGPFFAQSLRGIESVASAAGHNLL